MLIAFKKLERLFEITYFWIDVNGRKRTLPKMFQTFEFGLESGSPWYVVLKASGVQFIVTEYVVMNE